MNRIRSAPAARAVVTELLTAACGGAWIAARELDATPWRRRAVRAGVVAASATAILLIDPPGRERPGAAARPSGTGGKPPAPVLAASAAVTAGALYGWRLVENRWIARLAARGHTRPAVGVGARVALAHLAVFGGLRLGRAASRRGRATE